MSYVLCKTGYCSKLSMGFPTSCPPKVEFEDHVPQKKKIEDHFLSWNTPIEEMLFWLFTEHAPLVPLGSMCVNVLGFRLKLRQWTKQMRNYNFVKAAGKKNEHWTKMVNVVNYTCVWQYVWAFLSVLYNKGPGFCVSIFPARFCMDNTHQHAMHGRSHVARSREVDRV